MGPSHDLLRDPHQQFDPRGELLTRLVARMPIQTFWLEQTGRVRIALRRYASRSSSGWTCADGWHQAVAWTGEEVDEVRGERGHRTQPIPTPPHDDPRWPTECEKGCGYRSSTAPNGSVTCVLGPLWLPTDATADLRVLHTSV
jgi:hypothetical protein